MDKNSYPGVPFSCSLLDFDKYIVHSEDNKTQLYNHIKNCQIDTLKIRCDVWRLCLGIIDVDATWEQKLQQLQKERQKYQSLVNKHIKKQHIQQALSQNPVLAKNPLGRLLIPKPVALPTKQESDDKFLEDEVRKDVERTYQQKQFFTNPAIIKVLSKVLFIWSKQFPEISYKQGMNEVSASVIWVYFSSAIDPNFKYKQYQGIVEELREKYLLFHSTQHAEADIYSIFDKMMNSGHKEMFKAESETNKQINPNSKNNTPILQRIIKLSDIKFKMVDAELFKHIKLNEVTMRTFLLRWIRCIHTRQFQLEESFALWDNIFLAFHFSDKQGLYFIDCTTLAMLVYLREVALKKDSGFQILQLYQKYPKIQGKYLQELVGLAWIIKEQLDVGFQRQAQKKKQLQTHQTWSSEQKPSDHSNKVQNSHEQELQPSRSQSSLNYPSLQSGFQKKASLPQKKSVDINKVQNKSNVQDKKAGSSMGKEKQYQFDIAFNYQEWKEIESLMKKSIQQNTDLQSRSSAMKVMKIFERKEQQEIKKIQSNNSLMD